MVPYISDGADDEDDDATRRIESQLHSARTRRRTRALDTGPNNCGDYFYVMIDIFYDNRAQKKNRDTTLRRRLLQKLLNTHIDSFVYSYFFNCFPLFGLYFLKSRLFFLGAP